MPLVHRARSSQGANGGRQLPLTSPLGHLEEAQPGRTLPVAALRLPVANEILEEAGHAAAAGQPGRGPPQQHQRRQEGGGQ